MTDDRSTSDRPEGGADDRPSAPRGPDAAARATDRPLLRQVVLALAVVRYLVPIVAIAAVPALLASERTLLLVLVRPTKEFLLLGGGLLRTQGEPSALGLFLAAAPLMIVGTWVFFALGRLYGEDLRRGDEPAWLARMLPPDALTTAQRVLERRGPTIAVLARVAALPSTIIAAAAGTSRVRALGFLAADLVGALLAFAAMVGAGVALGDAYRRGGVWLTAVGVVVVVVLISLVTRWVRREAERDAAAVEVADRAG